MPYFVRRHGVDAAPEGDELHEIDVFVPRDELRRAVEAGVVRPLVEHVDLDELPFFEDGIFGKHGDAEARQKLVDAVVDLGVGVIGSAREHDDVPPLALGFR